MKTIKERAKEASNQLYITEDCKSGIEYGYEKGAIDEHDIVVNKAVDAFDEFLDYLYETGRISLEDSMSAEEWSEKFKEKL